MKKKIIKNFVLPFCFIPLFGVVGMVGANKHESGEPKHIELTNVSMLPLPCGFPNKGIVNSSVALFTPSDTPILQYPSSPVIIIGPQVRDIAYSADGKSYITLQSDGNLVVFGREDLGGGLFAETRRLWDTGTAGLGGVKLFFQLDGNLVLKNSAGGIVWASGIYTTCGNGSAAYFTLQNDSNFVMRYPQDNGKSYNLGDTNTAKGRTSGSNHKIK